MGTIRQKRPGQWQVLIRRQGWPHQSATFKSKKAAQAWERKIEFEMDQGRFRDHSLAQTTTLHALIQTYIRDVTNYRPSEDSRISETRRLEKFIRDEPSLSATATVYLKPEQFEDYRDRRCMVVAPATVKRELGLLKRVLDHRMRQLGLVQNPLSPELVKRPSFNDERDVRLNPDDRKRLIQECYKARNPLIGPFVELGFETGARRGSLLRLEWKDVNISASTALLRGVKNSRNPGVVLNHEIGLSKRALEVILALPRSDDRLLPMTANAFRLGFNRARERAGVKHFRFHDARHERVSSLFEAGWSTVLVMAQSGHRDPKSVKRYANIRGEHLAEKLAEL
ncbi:MAG: site-specific integrase [Pseudomonadota bacterium]